MNKTSFEVVWEMSAQQILRLANIPRPALLWSDEEILIAQALIAMGGE